MKKLLFLFALSLGSLAVWAQQPFYDFSAVASTGQLLYYRYGNNNTVSVTCPNFDWDTEDDYYDYDGYTKPSGVLIIPSTVTYNGTTYTVTGIGNHAFYVCENLTNVIIPSTVDYIGNSAFFHCSSLSSISIPNSVTRIGDNAFSECVRLHYVDLPNTVTNVYYDAFNGINVVNYCGTVSTTNWGAYHAGCFYVEGDFVYADYSKTVLFGYRGNSANVTIPSSVIAIGDRAFSYCSNVTSVTIPNTVVSIGQYAFYHCDHLSGVSIPNSVLSIGSWAFVGTNVLNYCGSATGSPWGANRAGCFYAEGDFVYLDNTKTSLVAYLGAGGSVTIPNTVTNIEGYAFWNCTGLTSVTIPNSVTTIGEYAFQSCRGLTSVTIPNSVNSIGNSAFRGCSGLTSITIPNQVTSIGQYSFGWCTGLTSVTILNSVTTIEDYAFSYCFNIKTVYNLSELTITKGSFSNGGVASDANRVVVPSTSGSGANTIFQIPDIFSFVDVEDNVETHIPRATIPNIDNLIYNDGGWKAKNIALTDGQDAFEAPETFTAETATYTREFTNSNRSTLYLPFTAAIPANFEVYDFSNFANNTISFTKREDSIYAYTPYLVGYDLSKDGNTTTCTITKTNAVFPKSESANYHPVTRNGMTFQGVLERTEMTSTNNYGYSNGFFVQSGGSAHVNPFRCYFTYSPSGNAPQSLPPSLNVEVGYGDPVGIDAVEAPEQEYDGRYGNDVYDMLGRLVRKNATNLEGLPKGVYIWKGKKIMNYDL